MRTIGVAVIITKFGKTTSGVLLNDLYLVGYRGDGCKSGARCIAFGGGKLDEGESVMQCADREVREETGLEVSFTQDLGKVPCLAVTDHWGHAPHITFWIQAFCYYGEPRVMEPEMCREWFWKTTDEIRAMKEALVNEEPSLYQEQEYWMPNWLLSMLDTESLKAKQSPYHDGV